MAWSGVEMPIRTAAPARAGQLRRDAHSGGLSATREQTKVGIPAATPAATVPDPPWCTATRQRGNTRS